MKILNNILVEELAAEGKSIFKYEGKVFFIQHVIPGDIITAQIIKSKKKWGEANLISIEQNSPNRQKPFCQHFQICGGCKWQMLPYQEQFLYKQKEVFEAFKRIGKIDTLTIQPILIPAEQNTHYRNKLEFAFSNKTFLDKEILSDKNISTFQPALGFHTNRIFDKIIPIKKCHLMDDEHNAIRNALFDFCVQNDFSFFDRRTHLGLMRNVMLRFSSQHEILVNVIFGENNMLQIEQVMNFLGKTFPAITSLFYTINQKLNDTIYDLTPVLFKGKAHIVEKLKHVDFEIGPKSFFQTNTQQAENLYQQIKNYIQPSGYEKVLDLYCGVGSIGIFLSRYVQQILGVELVAEAIEDAKRNAVRNQIANIDFVQGDIEKMVKQHYFESISFQPDVVIVDPPRNGLSPQVIDAIVALRAKTIIYVSCNAATQARDMDLLRMNYELKNLSIVDMFPHTHHIETIAELKRID